MESVELADSIFLRVDLKEKSSNVVYKREILKKKFIVINSFGSPQSKCQILLSVPTNLVKK